MSHRIIFIDSNVAEYQSLIPQLPEDSEVIVLGASKDGVSQILDALQGKTEICVIDIISHGAPGALMLGSVELNNANLAVYAEQLTQMGANLSDTADILLYGCEVAQGRQGQTFIEQLSLLTGANVAASINLTGAEAFGGDWLLEAHTGVIKANALQLSYSSVLGLFDFPKYDTFKFGIGTSLATSPQYISATALSNGGFVASWWVDDSSGGRDVYAQRFDANGVAQGSEFRVNTSTEGEQGYPSITGLSNGGFVVSWSSFDTLRDDIDEGIYAQRYDSNGVAQGAEFKVNTSPIGIQFNDISVAALTNGGFVVSWKNGAQRYDANGVAQGGEFYFTTDRADNPSIAGLTDGGFVASWDNSSDYNVYAQRYDANGVAQGGKFRVNTYTDGYQTDPMVTGLSNGGFVVGWYDHSNGGMAQRYDANGVAQGEQFHGPGGEFSSIAALSEGGFVLVGDYAYSVQRYDANGVPQGVELNPPLGSSGASPYSYESAVVGLPNDSFVVFWSGNDAYGVRLDANNKEVAPGSSGIEPADRLFNWAESTYTDLFPNHAASQEIEGYHARIYENGNALGEQSSNIYFYDGHSIALVGTVDDFLPGAIAAGF